MAAAAPRRRTTSESGGAISSPSPPRSVSPSSSVAGMRVAAVARVLPSVVGDRAYLAALSALLVWSGDLSARMRNAQQRSASPSDDAYWVAVILQPLSSRLLAAWSAVVLAGFCGVSSLCATAVGGLPVRAPRGRRRLRRRSGDGVGTTPTPVAPSGGPASAAAATGAAGISGGEAGDPSGAPAVGGGATSSPLQCGGGSSARGLGLCVRVPAVAATEASVTGTAGDGRGSERGRAGCGDGDAGGGEPRNAAARLVRVAAGIGSGGGTGAAGTSSSGKSNGDGWRRSDVGAVVDRLASPCGGLVGVDARASTAFPASAAAAATASFAVVLPPCAAGSAGGAAAVVPSASSGARHGGGGVAAVVARSVRRASVPGVNSLAISSNVWNAVVRQTTHSNRAMVDNCLWSPHRVLGCTYRPRRCRAPSTVRRAPSSALLSPCAVTIRAAAGDSASLADRAVRRCVPGAPDNLGHRCRRRNGRGHGHFRRLLALQLPLQLLLQACALVRVGRQEQVQHLARQLCECSHRRRRQSMRDPVV